MPMRKIIKSSLISLAVLGMVGGSLNNAIVNAKHRHVHYTRRIKHTRRHGKRSRLYRYHGRIRYSYRRNRHARRHYAKRYRRIRNRKPRYHVARRHHAKRSKANATHKYIVGTNMDGGQLLGGDPRFAAAAEPGSSDDGTLVKVGKKVVLDGHTFYKISSKDDIDANGWIYAGDLSNRPNGKAHPFNWVKNEPKIEKWEDQQNGDSDVDNNNTSDNTNHSHTSNDTYGPDYDDTDNPTTDRNISKEEIKLINQDRADHNKAPLQESSALDQIARMRAKQTNDNTTGGDLHMDPNTGKPYDDEVAQKLGYNNLVGTMGENLATSGHNAKGFNKELYSDEEPYDGGHYQNIVGDTNITNLYNKVGVGTYDDTIAEDFSLK